MGMFDYIMVDCPSCGAEQSVEFQSKGGECTLHDYTLDDAPPEVLRDIHYPGTCRECKKTFSFKISEQKVVVGYIATLIPISTGDTP